MNGLQNVFISNGRSRFEQRALLGFGNGGRGLRLHGMGPRGTGLQRAQDHFSREGRFGRLRRFRQWFERRFGRFLPGNCGLTWGCRGSGWLQGLPREPGAHLSLPRSYCKGREKERCVGFVVMDGELFDIQDKTDRIPIGIASVDHRESEDHGYAALHIGVQRARGARVFTHEEGAEIPVLEHYHPPVSGPLRMLPANSGKVEDGDKLAAEVRQACHKSGSHRELLEWLARKDIHNFTLRNREDRAERFELDNLDWLMPEQRGKSRIRRMRARAPGPASRGAGQQGAELNERSDVSASEHRKAHPGRPQDRRELLDQDIFRRPFPFVLIDKKAEGGAIQGGFEDPRGFRAPLSADAKSQIDNGDDAVPGKRYSGNIRGKEGDARNLVSAQG